MELTGDALKYGLASCFLFLLDSCRAQLRMKKVQLDGREWRSLIPNAGGNWI